MLDSTLVLNVGPTVLLVIKVSIHISMTINSSTNICSNTSMSISNYEQIH